jgi:hypothetical protein
MKKRSWTNHDLMIAVRSSRSIRQVIKKIGLIPAGGNYSQVHQYIKELNLDTSHLKGKGWNKGMSGVYFHPVIPLDEVLVKGKKFQSHKLKQRLIRARIKKAECEECGWAKISEDGRQPLELHHLNGDSEDNRLHNLMILCPNCHSLMPNYRGRKK